jgi:hypothetical protein
MYVSPDIGSAFRVVYPKPPPSPCLLRVLVSGISHFDRHTDITGYPDYSSRSSVPFMDITVPTFHIGSLATWELFVNQHID